MRTPEVDFTAEASTLGFVCERDMLAHFYLEQMFSIADLSHILGFSTFAVRKRLLVHGIPRRGKGGPNRIGKRYLAYVSDEELFNTSAGKLAAQHAVHIATVFAEKRLRAKKGSSVDEKNTTVLRDSASEVVEPNRGDSSGKSTNTHGSSAMADGTVISELLPEGKTEG